MEYKIEVQSELGIMVSTSTGQWNIADSDAVTQEITRLSRENGIIRVIINHRDLDINVSELVAYRRPLELKSHFTDIYPRVAFVSPRDRHGLYKFFTLVARNRGITFKAFQTYEEAFDWVLPAPGGRINSE